MESKAICCVCCSEPSAFTRLSSGVSRLSSRAASIGRSCCSRQLSSSSDLQRKDTRGWASKLAITSRNMSPGSRAFVWNQTVLSYNLKQNHWNKSLSRNITTICRILLNYIVHWNTNINIFGLTNTGGWNRNYIHRSSELDSASLNIRLCLKYIGPTVDVYAYEKKINLNDNIMFDLMYTANIRVSSISEIPTIQSYITVVTTLKIKYKSKYFWIKTYFQYTNFEYYGRQICMMRELYWSHFKNSKMISGHKNNNSAIKTTTQQKIRKPLFVRYLEHTLISTHNLPT